MQNTESADQFNCENCGAPMRNGTCPSCGKEVGQESIIEQSTSKDQLYYDQILNRMFNRPETREKDTIAMWALIDFSELVDGARPLIAAGELSIEEHVRDIKALLDRIARMHTPNYDDTSKMPFPVPPDKREAVIEDTRDRAVGYLTDDRIPFVQMVSLYLRGIAAAQAAKK